MIFKLGDGVVWTAAMNKPEISEGVITRLQKDLCWVDNKHKPEDCLYLDFMWPAHVKGALMEVLVERARLQKQLDDSMKLVYELRNKVARGEL